MNKRNLVGHFCLALASLLAAFFGVFNVLFSDTTSSTERLLAVGLTFAIYLILSVLAHILWPSIGWMWVRWLVIPALLLGGFYLFKEFSAVSWYGAGVLVAAIAGATVGREVIGRKRAKPPSVPSI